MKLLWHARCGDMRAPDPRGAWTFCQCGMAAVRWVDPVRGILQASTHLPSDRTMTRIIGLDNHYLRAGLGQPLSDEEWREIAVDEAKAAEGYLFHESRRNSMVLVIAPGESRDTSWATDDDRPEQHRP